MQAPTLKLSDGGEIPQLGLGTWPMNDDETARAISVAVNLGYRHFDTAVNYGNEKGVGEGVRRSGVKREQVFVATKVPGRDHGYDDAKQSLAGSLARMRFEYVDLYLIHWPNPIENKYVETWRAFIDLQKEGKARSIGVSNFMPAHIDRLIDDTGVVPAVNQIQLYPAVTQQKLRAYNERQGIVTESWSPLGRGANAKYYGGSETFLDHPVLKEIAVSYNKTPGQVVLRWHVQLGLIPLPKSSNEQRLAENIDVFSFLLSDDDMMRISAIDDGTAEVADSNTHQEF